VVAVLFLHISRSDDSQWLYQGRLLNH